MFMCPEKGYGRRQNGQWDEKHDSLPGENNKIVTLGDRVFFYMFSFGLGVLSKGVCIFVVAAVGGR